jgi:hypothetical protein
MNYQPLQEQMQIAKGTKPSKYLVWLLLAYAVLVPFVKVAFLPYFDAKIQPTELVFLAILPAALLTYGRLLWPDDTWLRWAIIAYLAANLASGLWSGDLSAMLEAAGRVYLMLLALILAACVRKTGPDLTRKLLDAFLYGTAVLAVISYIGWIAAMLGYHNSLIQVYGNYPYLGTVVRARGFTGGAGMLIIVLLLPTLYAWRSWRDGQKSIYWVLLLLPLAVITFSKEILLLGLGLLLVEPLVLRYANGLRKWMILAGALAFWFGTHFIIQTRQPVAESDLAGTFYTSGELVWVGEDYQLLESSYSALKRAGVSVASKYPWLGVGPGQFGRFLPAEKTAGVYPEHLPLYDPHSTWLGAFSETGFFGFSSLLLLCLVFYRRFKHLEINTETEGMISSMMVFLLLMLILSVSKDVANVRFLWLAIGILLGLSQLPSSNSLALKG